MHDFFYFFQHILCVYDSSISLSIHIGGGVGGAPATAWATSAGGGGAAVCGEHTPLLQPGAAGCEAVAV